MGTRTGLVFSIQSRTGARSVRRQSSISGSPVTGRCTGAWYKASRGGGGTRASLVN